MQYMQYIYINEENWRFLPQSTTDEFQKLMGTKWDQDGNFNIEYVF